MQLKTWTKKLLSRKNSILFKTFTFFLVPILCFLIFTMIIIFYYDNYFKTDAESKYFNALNNISENMDNIFKEIFLTTSMLSIDKNITDIISSNNGEKLNNFSKIIDSIPSLSLFRSTKDIIDNVFILDKADDIIISNTGTKSLDIFFNDSYRFGDYPKDFWMNFTTNGFHILKPTLLTNSSFSRQKKVIPIIQSRIGDFPTKKLFVVTLNEDALRKMLFNYKFTEGSILSICDDDGNLFTSTSETSSDFSNWMKTVIRNYSKGNKSVLVRDYKGFQMIVMFKTVRIFSSNFVYTACIPISELYSKTDYIKKISVLTLILMLLLSVAISYILAVRVYNPIKKLVELTKSKSSDCKDGNTTGNEIDYINNNICRIISNSNQLAHELTTVLPIVGEQYLLKLLNRNNYDSVDEMGEILASVGVNFKHPYFCMAIIQLVFLENSVNSFAKTEQLNIYKGIMDILKNIFPENYQTYLLELSREKIILVLNLPITASIDEVENIIRDFYTQINADNIHLQVYCGIGRVYAGFSGMSKSYSEAGHALTQLPLYGHGRIKQYQDKLFDKGYTFTLQDENKLFNYLLGGLKQEAYELLSNISENVQEDSLKELYVKIYMIGCRVAKYTDIKPEKLLGDNYADITAIYPHMTVEALSTHIKTFFSLILSSCNKSGNRFNIQEIKAYIDRHYSEDIYLESLAVQHNISPDHLSKMLKETLGMPFQQYLSFVRISRAKTLLEDSKKTINSILQEVGFYSRNTFIRMFKKLEGITPSEYREIMLINKISEK